MLFLVGLVYAFISALASLFFLNEAMSTYDENLFILSIFFTLVSWSGIEWALWLLNYNLFELVLEPIVPLASFFLIWVATFVYLAETRFKRRDTVVFLGAIMIIFLVAQLCMDCL